MIPPDDLARIRAETERRRRMAAVYAAVGGGGLPADIDALLQHLDTLSEQAAFLADRLVEVYGESPNVDYIARVRQLLTGPAR